MEDLIWNLFEFSASVQYFMIFVVPLLISFYILSYEQRDKYDQMLGWFVLKAVGSIGMVMTISMLVSDFQLKAQLMSRFSIVEIGFAILFIFAFRHCFKSVLAWALLILDAFRLLMVYTFLPLTDFIALAVLFAVYSSIIYSLIGIAVFGIRNTTFHEIDKF